ncbi:MAG: hypothetical protein KDA84_07380 [Planctomycetaceae bacterium]|nr:hypothetical protein [Planctomycetaceae bacterium]
MLEIILLIVLSGIISDMARRRGRNPTLFSLLLIAFWLGGEFAGAVLGYSLSSDAGKPNMLLIYGLALGGAILGAGLAFLIARSLSPVDGVWRDLTKEPVQNSRLLGAIVGGVGGGVIGAGVAFYMYGDGRAADNIPMMVQAILAVGFIGALLGLVSGLQKG